MICVRELHPYSWCGDFTTFLYSAAGGIVVHSKGRILPREFPITDLQQISGPDGIGRITCTVSCDVGNASYIRLTRGEEIVTSGGVMEERNGTTAMLVVNVSDAASFDNREFYCVKSSFSFFYIYISANSKWIMHNYNEE